MNKRLLSNLAIILLIIGILVILIGFFGGFLAGADVASGAVGSSTATVQSFIAFGGSMVVAALVLFFLLNRLG